MPNSTFAGKTGKIETKNVALAREIIEPVMTDIFRANGGILLLEDLGVVESDLVAKFRECFTELRTQLVGVRDLIPTR